MPITSSPLAVLVILYHLLSSGATAQDPSQTFTSIYREKRWGAYGGGSGLGSEISYTTHTRRALSDIIRAYTVDSLLDAPCGSFHWMPLVVDSVRAINPKFTYTGIDVVENVIQSNKARFAGIDYIQFQHMDLSSPNAVLPKGNAMVLCRDALQHLSLHLIVNILENFSKLDAQIFVFGSYTQGGNVNINVGDYFKIDLTSEPFNFKPLHIVSEWSFDADKKHLLVIPGDSVRTLDFVVMRQKVDCFLKSNVFTTSC